ncbi:2-hydroxychromene-2-carboxylate isomerase [Tistlia consotensis]|uniref:2-hydroxychromene-2-carboxylate isomerase n=1 Tax=Tistlia consotensis USBA 355 TaxID=560819 RepID=A0A1Y6BDJ3_9PROT|nr:2-hydroxychromene-2-carboxylate isomerase [Tistlia consotensis]SMF04422.1 2-hydroxychromene-2-carboxylate isomerase [Tistlia consotensis USBA 355]SNR54453.1 2-hydroxychromene-2-carboxylate isomerase [Tistlia consotensis]
MTDHQAPGPIRFYLDFASPYAYAVHRDLEALAERHGRALEWRPILVWAVLKALGVPPPLESEAKRRYLLADMARSAAFHGLPYREPVRLPLSTHLAARIFHACHEVDPVAAKAFGRSVFRAFFAEGLDIADEAVLLSLAGEQGLAPDFVRDAMTGAEGKARLARAVEAALADGVVGSPFVLLDGEGFFGADRLPQIAWRLDRPHQQERSAP